MLRNGMIQVRSQGMLLDCLRSDISAHRGRKKTKPRFLKTEEPTKKTDFSAPRGDGNTCDLRGKRVEEAKRIAEKFFDHMEEGVVFLLHGHGTGVLKKAMRKWLPQSPYVLRFRAARPAEGGDAFTVVELKQH